MTLPDTLARAVAAGLTELQRAALLWLPADGAPKAETKQHEAPVFSLATVEICDGCYADLAYGKRFSVAKPMTWELTPFGRRVRAIVEAAAIKQSLNTEPVMEAGNG